MSNGRREVNILDDEILEQNNIGWDMNVEREVEELMAQNGGQWTIEDVYYYLYGSFASYDEPLKAMSYCDVTSPRYRGRDWWKRWKEEHWVGRDGMRERALKDTYACSYLKRFGLLPVEDTGAESLMS